jgi:transcriptional regulator with XRE-family HTH domain
MNSENIRSNISANIAYYRKAAKITQAQLASALSIKSTTVSTWERGASLPDAETLFKICDILRVSLAMIYGTDTNAGLDVFAVSQIEKDIILEYRKSDSLTKAMVLRTLSIDEQVNDILNSNIKGR